MAKRENDSVALKQLMQSFIKENNLDHEAYNLLGYVERQLQNYKLAISFYKKALSKFIWDFSHSNKEYSCN